jgi:hypothetical protein
MAHSRRWAHDENPTFVDLEAGMITGIRQRLDIIGWPGLRDRSRYGQHRGRAGVWPAVPVR